MIATYVLLYNVVISSGISTATTYINQLLTEGRHSIFKHKVAIMYI